MKRVALLFLVNAGVACGSPTKPPPPPAAELDASAPVAETPSPSVDASAPTASSVASAEPAPPPPPPAPADACTPIGVELEKRARPALKACYREGKKKDPELKGGVKLSIDIDTLGKLKGYRATDKTLPEPVVQCMTKALKDANLAAADAAKCAGKSITIPMVFPTPK